MAMATEERLQSPGLWCGSALAALAAVGRRVRPMPAPGAMGMFREAARGAGAAEQQRRAQCCPQRLFSGARNAVLSGARNAVFSGAGSVHFPATGACYYQMMSIMGKF